VIKRDPIARSDHLESKAIMGPLFGAAGLALKVVPKPYDSQGFLGALRCHDDSQSVVKNLSKERYCADACDPDHTAHAA
jgi:hypothetical protein